MKDSETWQPGQLKAQREKGAPLRPRGDLPPERLTLKAMIMAIIALSLTPPIFFESFSWSRSSDGITPWKGNFGVSAFLIGPISMIFRLRAIGREWRRDSKRGWWLALSTVLIAALGMFLWLWSAVAADREGLLGL